MSDTKTIFKIHKAESKFSIIPNALAQDSRLSFKATGLLVYLLSLPENWIINSTHIASAKAEGRDAIRGAFQELKDAGYAKLESKRGAGGKVEGSIWHIYAVSLLDNPEPEKQSLGAESLKNREPEKPTVGKSATTKETVLTKETKKTKATALAFEIPLALNTPEFEASWKEWIQHRKEIKKPMTPLAASKLLKGLEVMGVKRSVLAINHSISRGWQSINEEKSGGFQRPGAVIPKEEEAGRVKTREIEV